MKRLWIADAHANLPAFEAVLEAGGPADEIVFLGDIIGFGPHPAACIERLRHCGARALLGNHDAAILALRDRAETKNKAGNWNAWTLDQLDHSQLEWLANLPEILTVAAAEGDIQARHHPPGAPYLHPAMPDARLAEYLRNALAPRLFCGHSHRAIDRSVNGRRFVCVPPVGQPRNGDPRAGYALENNGRLSFHFVPYDIERTAADIQNIGLSETFCRRWLAFLRTGYDPEWSREYP